MIEIDNRKMWEYLLNNSKDPNLVEDIANGLKVQGYEWKDGEITTIEPKPKYYKCIKEYKGFTLGKIYKTNDNGDLPSDPGCPFVIWIENPYFEEFFRPATDEEISQENIPTFKEVERNGKDELIEFENEKIRKWLIEQLHNRIFYSINIDEKKKCINAIAWLKKQGKQIPVEPMPLYDCNNRIVYAEYTEQKPTDNVDNLHQYLYGDGEKPTEFGIWKDTKEKLPKPDSLILAIDDLGIIRSEYYEGDGYLSKDDDIKLSTHYIKWCYQSEIKEQNSTEWSEEDEKLINRVITLIKEGALCKGEKDYFIEKLESLKGRYSKQWKPTEEQIEALANALSLAKNCGEESSYDLRTLYEQLKKL